MRKLLLAAALAGVTFGTGLAVAQIAPPAKARADANGDGTVSRAEFIAQAGARFDARDTDHDGTMAAGERRGPMRANVKPMTRADALARAGAMFDRLDTDHNGALSDTERWSAMGRMGGKRGGPGMMTQPTGAPGGPDMAHGMRHAAGLGGKMMERVDTNKDGRISRDEMRTQADTRFARLDANRDGYLDQAEMQSAHRGMKHRGPARTAPTDDMPAPPAPPAK